MLAIVVHKKNLVPRKTAKRKRNFISIRSPPTH